MKIVLPNNKKIYILKSDVIYSNKNVSIDQNIATPETYVYQYIDYYVRRHLLADPNFADLKEIATHNIFYCSEDIAKEAPKVINAAISHSSPIDPSQQAYIDFLRKHKDNLHFQRRGHVPAGTIFVIEKINYSRFKTASNLVSFAITLPNDRKCKLRVDFESLDLFDFDEHSAVVEEKKTTKRKKSQIKI